MLEDPVIASDGHSYERSAIEDWLSGRNRTSPLTGARLQEIDLRANITLRKLIESFKEKLPRLRDREQKRTDLIMVDVAAVKDFESQSKAARGDLTTALSNVVGCQGAGEANMD